MKTLLAAFVFAAVLGTGCGHLKPDPRCQGDPLLISCSCMNPRSTQCPPIPRDAKKPKKEPAK